MKDDPGYCGLGKGMETDHRDPHWPACKGHDEAMAHQRDTGKLKEPIAKTQFRFAAKLMERTGIEVAQAMRAVIELPVKLVVGVSVGTAMQVWRLWRKK